MKIDMVQVLSMGQPTPERHTSRNIEPLDTRSVMARLICPQPHRRGLIIQKDDDPRIGRNIETAAARLAPHRPDIGNPARETPIGQRCQRPQRAGLCLHARHEFCCSDVTHPDL